MKEGLIRLTDEKDIFYDSIERVYRYRQHCPNCGTKIDNCMCYNDLDLLLSDIDEGRSDYTCSAKCALLVGEWDDFEIERGKSIDELTEDEAKEILEKLTSDFDEDYPHGDFCVS